MKHLAFIALLLSSCSSLPNYADINHSLVIVNTNEEACTKEVSHEYYDVAAFNYKSYNVIAISKTYNKIFKKEDLTAKAKELNACKVVATRTTSCADRTAFGEFQGCWNYDLIYFVK